MQKDLYIKENSQKKAVVKNDDLIFDGKNIVIPSYYAGIICDYLANVDIKSMDLNEADHHDYLAFCSFFEAIMDYKAANQGN
jgi:hypothetical protein